MRIDTEHLKLEKEIMTDYWSFRREWYNLENTDEYLSGLNQASNALHEKYRNDYLDQLILVCADDIERRSGLDQKSRKEMLMKLVERLCRKDR